jgi:hypothetical protein
MYAEGEGVVKSYQFAAKWLKAAAIQNYMFAQHTLGFMHEVGKGVPKDTREALFWYQKAAEQGDRDAHYALFRLYKVGAGHQGRNLELSIQHLTQSAYQGNVQAQYELAQYYERGDYVVRNFEQAVKWYRLAANNGNPQAQYFLGLLYKVGAYFGKNERLAAEWFEKAALQNDVESQIGLAEILFKNENADQAEKGIYWLTMAAETGDAEAEYLLSKQLIHLSKKKKTKSGHKLTELARVWLEKSARHGKAAAQYELALLQLSEQGNNTGSDSEELLQLAAKQGHRKAQLKLVELYQLKEQKNRMSALEWRKTVCQETALITCNQ